MSLTAWILDKDLKNAYLNARHCYRLRGWGSASHLTAMSWIWKNGKASKKDFLCLMEFLYAIQFVKDITCIDFSFENPIRKYMHP